MDGYVEGSVLTRQQCAEPETTANAKRRQRQWSGGRMAEKREGQDKNRKLIEANELANYRVDHKASKLSQQ